MTASAVLPGKNHAFCPAPKEKSPTPFPGWSSNLLPSATRWIAVSSGRARAKIHPKVAPVCTPACRVVTSIYTLRLKRWRQSAGFQLRGPRVNSRADRSWQPQQVRDCRYPCPRRFPEFSFRYSSKCDLFASVGNAQHRRLFEAKTMPCRQTTEKSGSYGAENRSTEDKLYALQMKFPCSI